MGFRWYFVIVVYVQVITFLLVLPIALGTVAGSWGVVGLAIGIFFVLTQLPAAYLHARYTERLDD
jgi:hypothetical protein